jgi:hypothetical protein
VLLLDPFSLVSTLRVCIFPKQPHVCTCYSFLSSTECTVAICHSNNLFYFLCTNCHVRTLQNTYFNRSFLPGWSSSISNIKGGCRWSVISLLLWFTG